MEGGDVESTRKTKIHKYSAFLPAGRACAGRGPAENCDRAIWRAGPFGGRRLAISAEPTTGPSASHSTGAWSRLLAGLFYVYFDISSVYTFVLHGDFVFFQTGLDECHHLTKTKVNP